jgi:hypothetical protein
VQTKNIGIVLCGFALLLSGCGEGESEIARNIKMKVSSGAIVLPTKLYGQSVVDGRIPTTCLADDVTGPRVRMRISLIWSGVDFGNLIPFLLRLELDTPMLSGKFSGIIYPAGEAESLSEFLGANTDYIEPVTDQTPIASDTCYLDFGGLPEPVSELTGRRELRVRGKVVMTGVTRTTADNGVAGIEKPFVKEVPTDVVYVVGSIPPESN